MSGCLADVAAALVDGELDHAARERAQRHLAHCDLCRAEVDLQRRLKARLSRVDPPAPSPALTSRLLGLADEAVPAGYPGTAPPGRPGGGPPVRRPVRAGAAVRAGATPRPGAAPRPGGAARAGAARSAAPRAATSSGPADRPSTRRARRALRRRATAGSAFALLGVAAALTLGAPPQRPAATSADPPTRVFVTELARTPAGTSVPLSPVPALRSPDLEAGLPGPLVPLTRSAGLTTGGSGSRR